MPVYARTRVREEGDERDHRADGRDHKQRDADALPVLALHLILEELLRANNHRYLQFRISFQMHYTLYCSVLNKESKTAVGLGT